MRLIKLRHEVVGARYQEGTGKWYIRVRRSDADTGATTELEDVVDILRVIDAEKIMPPVSVVQVLSRNGVASVGLVKEWLMARIKSARQEVDTVSIS